MRLGKIQHNILKNGPEPKKKAAVLILGAGRVCQPAAEMLSSIGSFSSSQWCKRLVEYDYEEHTDIEVIVGSLYLQDAEQVLCLKYFPFTSV